VSAPFEGLAAQPYGWFWVAVATAVATSVPQQVLGRRKLSNDVTTRPIVDFELARTDVRANELTASWKIAGATKWVWAAVLVDYGFLASYGFLLALLCSMGARQFRIWDVPLVPNLFDVAAYAALLAAGLDFAENCILLRILWRPISSSKWPHRAWRAAKTKFRLLYFFVVPAAVLGLLFDLLGCRFGCPPLRP
jgi:hypothetical protein